MASLIESFEPVNVAQSYSNDQLCLTLFAYLSISSDQYILPPPPPPPLWDRIRFPILFGKELLWKDWHGYTQIPDRGGTMYPPHLLGRIGFI